ncbi:chloride intracellular channel exl-1-like [Frankliniella occidentalis]|uniref:Chloride intracellular channel exl-1-like n=1 Tax=Frankliniella occidentalis TaxID=133901 RepID=A0A6J1SED3_FRAOC|nr:chloride intracellular channel exl-1-like [Frankliniella occidentalis]
MMNVESEDEIVLFVKLGYDGHSLGACHQSQRVNMLSRLKATAQVMPSPRVVPVNTAKPPKEFSDLDLRLRLPVLHIILATETDGLEPLDSSDDIVVALESKYPGGLCACSSQCEAEADQASRDFFSKFCFLVRGVAKESSHLESELQTLDKFLQDSSGERGEGGFLCGSSPSLLDCEILPKLHQVRVAAQALKGYSIPAHFSALWRYLYAAYSCPAFTESCPPDHEIILHWLEHCGTPEAMKQSRKLLSQIGSERHQPSYSFSIPAKATPVVIDD